MLGTASGLAARGPPAWHAPYLRGRARPTAAPWAGCWGWGTGRRDQRAGAPGSHGMRPRAPSRWPQSCPGRPRLQRERGLSGSRQATATWSPPRDPVSPHPSPLQGDGSGRNTEETCHATRRPSGGPRSPRADATPEKTASETPGHRPEGSPPSTPSPGTGTGLPVHTRERRLRRGQDPPTAKG